MHAYIGWAGAGLFLTAYVLLTMKKVDADNKSYHVLNILGGLCLALNTFATHDYASFFTNALWMCIGLWGLSRKVFSRKAT